MKSIRNLGSEPAGTPLLADDVLEFHAARLILLLKFCGTSNRIDGLTKLAKLDFFVRYPDFFREVSEKLGQAAEPKTTTVESSMVRFHYGPWDQRYYHILAYLRAKRLLAVSQSSNTYLFELTAEGKAMAKRLSTAEAYSALVDMMTQVKKILGKMRGSALKKLIYDTFDEEVTQKHFGEVID